MLRSLSRGQTACFILTFYFLTIPTDSINCEKLIIGYFQARCVIDLAVYVRFPARTAIDRFALYVCENG